VLFAFCHASATPDVKGLLSVMFAAWASPKCGRAEVGQSGREKREETACGRKGRWPRWLYAQLHANSKPYADTLVRRRRFVTPLLLHMVQRTGAIPSPHAAPSWRGAQRTVACRTGIGDAASGTRCQRTIATAEGHRSRRRLREAFVVSFYLV
jgi:hypothetical protein